MFDSWAPTYDESGVQQLVHGPVHQLVLEIARSVQPPPALILDAGCGTGRLLRRAAEVFPDAGLVGVDLSAAMLEQHVKAAADGSPAMQLVQARAECLPFRDGQFDLVFCTMALLHCHDPATGLGELGRVCAPGGRVLVADAFESATRHRPRFRKRPDPELKAVFRAADLRLHGCFSELAAVSVLLAAK